MNGLRIMVDKKYIGGYNKKTYLEIDMLMSCTK